MGLSMLQVPLHLGFNKLWVIANKKNQGGLFRNSRAAARMVQTDSSQTGVVDEGMIKEEASISMSQGFTGYIAQTLSSTNTVCSIINLSNF